MLDAFRSFELPRTRTRRCRRLAWRCASFTRNFTELTTARSWQTLVLFCQCSVATFRSISHGATSRHVACPADTVDRIPSPACFPTYALLPFPNPQPRRLAGVKIVFTGVIPLNMPLDQAPIAMMARRMGAEILENVCRLRLTESCEHIAYRVCAAIEMLLKICEPPL